MKEGGIFTYSHHNNQVGALVVIRCETDFAARTDVFKNFGEKLAMQAAFVENNDDFLHSQLIFEGEERTVEEFVKDISSYLKEKIDFQVVRHAIKE